MPFDFLYIPPEHLRPALLAALMSVSVLIGLFAYLNVYTRRRYFSIWMVAWLFYALWLFLTVRLEDDSFKFLLMAKTLSVGISAVFLSWGSIIFMGRRIRQRLFVLLLLFLAVWSYVGTYHVENPLQAKLPVFATMGISSILAARCFLIYRWRRRYAGATLLCAGFALWGAFLIGYPFLERWHESRATVFVLAALLQLFIAVSMIILVLEEARRGRSAVLQRMAIAREIRRDLETRVQSSEARFHCLFEQASDAIVVTTRTDFFILELNARARKLLGLTGVIESRLSLRAFLGSNLPTQGAGPARVKETQRLDRVLPGAPLNLVSRDGKQNAVTVERTAIDLYGEPAFQFVFREITERTQLEQQIRQAEKLSALGQMISGIAHELNNPLAVIKGYLDLMQTRHDLPEAVRADLRKVVNESNRAAKLVRSFLSFAREQPPQRVPVDLNTLVRSVIELRKYDSMVAQTEMVLDLEPSLPAVKADPDQVQQVLVNLINNALHEIVAMNHPGRLLIRTEHTASTIRVRVGDNGPGVPVELRDKIFEPFFTTKETGAGTGLGLSIAHSILTEHGGRIFCAKSALGGAEFVLEFPPAPEEAAVATVVPLPAVPSAPARTGRILVLDDEEVLAEMLGQMLSLQGHEVTVCSTPQRALECVRNHTFDAILSDYRMPLIDGREFHARVQQYSAELASRIIFLTGDVVSEETRSFFSSIGNRRLTKPFQLETVAQTINEVLLPRAA